MIKRLALCVATATLATTGIAAAPAEAGEDHTPVAANTQAAFEIQSHCENLGAGKLCVTGLNTHGTYMSHVSVEYKKKSGAKIRARLILEGDAQGTSGRGVRKQTGWRTVKKGQSTRKIWTDVRMTPDCLPYYGFRVWGHLAVKGGRTYSTLAEFSC